MDREKRIYNILSEVKNRGSRLKPGRENPSAVLFIDVPNSILNYL